MLVYNVYLFFSVFLVFFSSNWFFIWVCLELSTLSLVVLLSYYRTPRATEATVKYFITQSLAGVILLLGILFQLFFYGNFFVFNVYSDFNYFLILVGLFIKVAVIPNPFWFIDVVSGLSLVRGFYVVIISKVVPVYLYILVCSIDFYYYFVFVGLVSVFFGTVFGINQTSLRKIISLSSVSHFGWMIISFSVLSAGESFFVFVLYIFMILPLFFVGYCWSIENVNKLSSLYHSFFLVIVLIISLLSLAGFPPLIGFFYKWVMFLGLVGFGSYLVSGFLILFSLVSLYYYLLICYNVYSLYLPSVKFSFYNNYFLTGGLGVIFVLFVMLALLFFYLGPVVSFLFA